jgi:hypothetical protein
MKIYTFSFWLIVKPLYVAGSILLSLIPTFLFKVVSEVIEKIPVMFVLREHFPPSPAQS